MNKFWKDIIFEANEFSQKRIIAWCLGVLTVIDALLLMYKSWISDKVIDTIDVTFFGVLFGGFCTLMGVAMVNKMPQFRKSTNEIDKEDDVHR